jgi:hypothetical protein
MRASVILMIGLVAACGGGGGGGTCGDAIDESCGGAACGGDVVGTWRLVQFCGPSCVSSVYDTIELDADGTYRGGGYVGTWTISGGSLVTTVAGSSSSAAFCVDGDRLWTERTTNCGTGSGPLTIVRRRDCGGSADAGIR